MAVACCIPTTTDMMLRLLSTIAACSPSSAPHSTFLMSIASLSIVTATCMMVQVLSSDCEWDYTGYKSQSSSICSVSDVETDDEAWPEALVLPPQPVASPFTLSQEPAAEAAPALLHATSQAVQTPSLTLSALSANSALSHVPAPIKMTPAQTPTPTSFLSPAKPTGSAQATVLPLSATWAFPTSPVQTETPLRLAQTVTPALRPAQPAASGLQAITGVVPAKKADSTVALQMIKTPMSGLQKAPREVDYHVLPCFECVDREMQLACKPALIVMSSLGAAAVLRLRCNVSATCALHYLRQFKYGQSFWASLFHTSSP